MTDEFPSNPSRVRIVTAADACKIGRKHAEQQVEKQFADIMKAIAHAAQFSNVLELSDKVGNSRVFPCSVVEFLQSHPEQVDRLVNMGFAVEQDVDDTVEVDWQENENYTVPYLYFWEKCRSRMVKRTDVVTVRKFTITWECEECDDNGNEETV